MLDARGFRSLQTNVQSRIKRESSTSANPVCLWLYSVLLANSHLGVLTVARIRQTNVLLEECNSLKYLSGRSSLYLEFNLLFFNYLDYKCYSCLKIYSIRSNSTSSSLLRKGGKEGGRVDKLTMT